LSVAIGGVAAEVVYKGEIAAGVLQLNVKVPDPASGAQSAVLTVGGSASPGVTIYVK
jgi:uncharacterized protein (TIGR03437 family)